MIDTTKSEDEPVFWKIVTNYEDQFVDPEYEEIGITHMMHPLSWSPDGNRIASARDTATIQVWDAATGKLLSSYTSPSAPEVPTSMYEWIFAIQWSPDGEYLAATANSQAFVWEVATGKTIATYPTSGLSPLAWSPDKISIASVGTDGIHIWNALLGKLRAICLYDTFGIDDLCWSPDGNSIAAAHGNAVDIWNPGGGSRIWTYEGHTGPVHAITWSPDGTRVASASEDETVHIWQIGENRTLTPAS